MKAVIITIGDELLMGQVIDTNSAYLGEVLNEAGVEIIFKMGIPDEEGSIVEALDLSLEKADLVIMTGGLGPTKDDITKKTLADYFNKKLFFHQPTWERIEYFFKKLGRPTTDAHRDQCYMPEGIKILKNGMGTAPGMQFEREGKYVISMPGVPYEMKYITEHAILPLIESLNGENFLVHRTIRTVGEGESRIAQRIQPILDNMPAHLKMAYLPSLGQVRLRLSARGKNKEQLKHDIAGPLNLIKTELKELVFGYDKEVLEEAIGKLCIEKKIKIGTAESCTGGRIANRLTSIAGSSSYFMGTVVAYANEVKIKELGVKENTLEEYGAVSEETVIEMLEGLLDRYPIDLGVAVSGIAGPGGGSAEKPVGTIWFAYGSKGRIKTFLLKAGKKRTQNIEYASTHGLNLLRKFLLTL